MSERIGCNVCIEKDIDRIDVIGSGKVEGDDALRYGW
jgi:hypothetical protein